MRYSEGFRNSVLRKVLPPESRSVYAVAKEVGVSPMTLQNWLSKVKEGKMIIDSKGAEPTPSERGPAEKLRLLLESRTLSEDQKGDWLRRHGMHTEHLSLWEQELEGIVTDKQQNLKQENSDLKKENKELKKELARSQAAMAEALALLTLKKKADRLLGLDEEN
jgi:transposase-like protein